MNSEHSSFVEMRSLVRHIQDCNNCELCETRNTVVSGYGSIPSTIIFIGEAPGKNEDICGQPFVGRAGKIFEELLESIGLQREDVYVTNILKCRPPKNRNPTNNEISHCTPWLNKQLSIVDPNVIVPMGTFAAKYFFEKFDLSFSTIGKIHGKKYDIQNTIFSGIIYPLYHPAAAIYNKKLLTTLQNDFKKILDFISPLKDNP